MSGGLPGVALYPDDLSVVRDSLSAARRRCLNGEQTRPATPTRTPAGGGAYCTAMDEKQALELLASERTRIEAALGELTPPDSEAVVDPFEAADVGQDMFDEELAQERETQLQTELEAIERAERRVAEGTYGLSVESGEPIPDARLQAIPWAERTAEEQARYEAAGL
jgi:DnaK suppressor protein